MTFYGSKPAREKAIDLPAVVLWTIAGLTAVQLIRTVLPETDDVRVLLEGSFVPAPWTVGLGLATPDAVLHAVAERVGDDPDGSGQRLAFARYLLDAGIRPWSWLTCSVLHGSWVHLGLNLVWLAAFGTPVARRAGAWRFGALWLAASAAGAVAQWLSDPLAVTLVLGASAAVSALMGAVATFGFGGRERGRWGFLRSRPALIFLAVWFVGNALFGLIAGPLGIGDGAIAWQAHIGGLLAGVVLFPLIDPA